MIYAVGREEFVRMFMLLGLAGEVVGSAEELLSTVEKLASRDDVELILVERYLSGPVRDRLDSIRLERPLPLILEVPGLGEEPRFRRDYMRLLKMALGY